MSGVIRSSDRSGVLTGSSASIVSSGTTQSSRSANPDQWYLDEIEKYKGTDFYDYLLTNPHLISNSGQYSPYWYEELLGVSDVNADRYNNQLRSDAMNWLGNALSEKHVEDYTDPVAEVARRKAAGINDDLSGGSQIGSGQPANPQSTDTDTNLPSPSGVEGLKTIGDIGSHLVSMAFQIYSGFQSIRSASLDNDIKSLNLSGLLTDEGWRVISEGTSEFLNNDTNYSPGSSIESVLDSKTGKLVKPLLESMKNRLHNLPYSNRNKHKIESLLDSLIYSSDDSIYGLSAKYETMVRNTLSGLNKSRSDYAKSYGEIGADTQSQDALRFIGKSVYTPLNELTLDVAKKTNELQKQYLDSAIKGDVGSLKASSEGAKYKFLTEMNKVRDRIASSFSAINRAIVNSSDLSPVWKVALQGALASTEAYSFSKLLGGMQ